MLVSLPTILFSSLSQEYSEYLCACIRLCSQFIVGKVSVYSWKQIFVCYCSICVGCPSCSATRTSWNCM